MAVKERCSGSFRAKTKNHVPVIGNTYAPVAPVVSARNLSNVLEGSVVFEQNGFGVSQYELPSHVVLLCDKLISLLSL